MSESKSKHKILFVAEAMGGGVFTYLVDLANGLCSNYDIYIAHGIRKQTPADYCSYFDPSIHLIYIPGFTREINLQKDIQAFFEIRKLAEKIHPDIIHLHSSKAGVIGRFAFDGKEIPLFYTPHGYSFLMQNYKPVKRMIFKAVEAICAKRKCTTISCSAGEHKETLKLTHRARYVNNGINVSKLQQLLNDIQPSEHNFTVFTLGRISYQKNPELFNQIALKMPEVYFLWIGDGELRDKLTASNIEITGWLNRSKALERAVNADCFLLPSLWEGLPISLLESMYMRKLCVVSNVIDNKDVIRNHENGYVCTSLNSYVNAIRSAMDHSVSIDLINNAYQDVLKEYNTDVMVRKYHKIYNKAIEGSSER